MPSRLAAHLALFTVAAFYAGNYLVAKSIMNNDFVGPLGFVLLRVSVATAMFWTVSLIIGMHSIERKDIPRFMLCGLTGATANQAFFFLGLERTTPIHASLILTITPILVLVFSRFILHEKITLRKLIGLALGFAGAVVLVTFGKEVIGNPDYVLGDMMIFVNATSYAIYLVIVKHLINKYPPLTVIKWVFLFGFCFMLPIGFAELKEVDWQTFTRNTWIGVAYVIVCVTFLAYLLNIYALKRVTPSIVGFYIYLQPLLAALLSVWVGMETLGPAKLTAGILIFSGVFLVSDIRLRVAPAQKQKK